MLNVVSEKLGYSCHEVNVGFKYVSSGLIETNSVVGGESTGGLAIQNHIWGKDSLLSIALCLKILVSLNKPFNEIIEDLLSFADNYSKIIMDKSYHYDLKLEKEIKSKVFEQKLLPKQEQKVREIIYKDYVKIYYENGDWALIRFSGTEPVLRIFVEADDEINCKKLIKDWEDLLNL